jgi:uncharacterized membrane protein YjgN (DUF898 family)
METTSKKYFHLNFDGNGNGYFGIWVVNIILTIITLGLYYPWAKIANRKYIWNSTSMQGDRFVFNGTGIEIFRGFVIAYSILAVSILLVFFSPYLIFIFYLILFLIMPFAIFGAWRYRISRTSWRGIYFSFDGNMREFFNLFFLHFILTILTFGIYGSWFNVKIMNYLFSHTRFGQYKMNFVGKGEDLFVINLLGVILTFITFGIYGAWYLKNRFHFTIENTLLQDENSDYYLRCNLDGGDVFVVNLANGILSAITLGLFTPWAIMRTQKLLLESVFIPEDLELDSLEQSADDFNDATGDSLLDILDVGLDF